MMKYSMLFERGPLPPMSTSHLPDVIHVIGVSRPSPFFAALPLLCIILNANRRTKWGRDLGMRLVKSNVCIYSVDS